MNSERYIRQIRLGEFGAASQQKLLKARVLVIGIGGLGIPVLQYLNAMGVGTLGMIEQDTVALSNLHRQVLYDEAHVGASKLKVAIKKLHAQNSNTTFKSYEVFLQRENALDIISDYDIVVDASDNFPTRYLVNDACVLLHKPFVYGAIHGFEGQVSVFNYRQGPTYRCLFPDMPGEEEIPDCNEHGVLGVIPGIIGTFQALEVVKIITQIGEILSGKLLIYNGLNQSIQKVSFEPILQNLQLKGLQPTYGELFCGTGLEINPHQLQHMIEAGEKPQMIDVRSAEEFRAFHVQQSVNIPLNELGQRSAEINADKKVYFLCQSGQRSQSAQRQFQKIHPRCKVFSLTGGMDNYALLST
ncbi:MAG TPA: HesA/MoeB/ThiF family protein [Eudoraea sp.]|nr:HesA/MoeB/ThiF family protein [Eudoraea sp.]